MRVLLFVAFFAVFAAAQPAVLITDGYGVNVMCFKGLGEEAAGNSVLLWGTNTGFNLQDAFKMDYSYASADGTQVFFATKGKPNTAGFLARLNLPSPTAEAVQLPLPKTDIFVSTPPGEWDGVGGLAGTGNDLAGSNKEYVFYFWDQSTTTREQIRVYDVKTGAESIVQINITGCQVDFSYCTPLYDLHYHNGSVYWYHKSFEGALTIVSCIPFDASGALAASCTPTLAAETNSTVENTFAITPSDRGWVIGTENFGGDLTQLFILPYGFQGPVPVAYTFPIGTDPLGLAAGYDLSYNFQDGYLYFVCYWGCQGTISRLRLSDFTGMSGTNMADRFNPNSVRVLSSSCAGWFDAPAAADDSGANTHMPLFFTIAMELVVAYVLL